MRITALAAWLALPAALAASSAFAQESGRATRALEVNGTSLPACVIQPAVATGSTNATFLTTSSATAQINITQFVDTQTAEPRASQIAISLPVTCNASHRITVASQRGGLLRAGATGRSQSGGFAQFVPYRIRLGWAGQDIDRASNTGPATVDSANGAVGSLALQIDTPGGGNPLLAGQYDDSIVIQFQPAN